MKSCRICSRYVDLPKPKMDGHALNQVACVPTTLCRLQKRRPEASKYAKNLAWCLRLPNDVAQHGRGCRTSRGSLSIPCRAEHSGNGLERANNISGEDQLESLLRLCAGCCCFCVRRMMGKKMPCKGDDGEENAMISPPNNCSATIVQHANTAQKTAATGLLAWLVV